MDCDLGADIIVLISASPFSAFTTVRIRVLGSLWPVPELPGADRQVCRLWSSGRERSEGLASMVSSVPVAPGGHTGAALARHTVEQFVPFHKEMHLW